MSKDILERAKDLRHYLANKAEWQDESVIVQELIAEVEAKDEEVERLRSDFEHLEIDCSAWRRSSERKDARIKELEATLVDVRAEYLLLLDTNQDTVAWQLDEISEQDQDKFRRQARESLKMEEPLVMIQLREARGQIERLAAAFLKSETELRVYQKLCPNPSWENSAQRVRYWSEQEAREVLERIKEGGKDEAL